MRKLLLIGIFLSSTAWAQAQTVSLAWDPSTNSVGYVVERCSGVNCSNFVSVGSPTTNLFNDSGLVTGTSYSWRVLAYNAAGNSGYSNTFTDVIANAADTAAPSVPGQLIVNVGTPTVIWTDQDIGSVGIIGSASSVSPLFTVAGSGADIWGTADAFHFLYRSLSGDGQIIARVVSQQNTQVWAKAGVMIRETLTADSSNVLMAVTPGNGLTFQRRVSTAGSSAYNSIGVLTAPYWVKLTRVGNAFAGYISSDGIAWTLVGSSTIVMTPTVFIGLAVTAHDNTKLCTSTFDNIR